MTALDLRFARNFSGSTNLRFGNTDDAVASIDAVIALIPAINAEAYQPSFSGVVSCGIPLTASISAYHVPHVGTVSAQILFVPSIIGFLPVTSSFAASLPVNFYGNAFHLPYFGTIDAAIPVTANFSAKGNDWNFQGQFSVQLPVSAQFSAATGASGEFYAKIPVTAVVHARRGAKALIAAQIQPIVASIFAHRGVTGLVSAKIHSPTASVIAKHSVGAIFSSVIPVNAGFAARHLAPVYGSVSATIDVHAALLAFIEPEEMPDYTIVVYKKPLEIVCRDA